MRRATKWTALRSRVACLPSPLRHVCITYPSCPYSTTGYAHNRRGVLKCQATKLAPKSVLVLVLITCLIPPLTARKPPRRRSAAPRRSAVRLVGAESDLRAAPRRHAAPSPRRPCADRAESAPLEDCRSKTRRSKTRRRVRAAPTANPRSWLGQLLRSGAAPPPLRAAPTAPRRARRADCLLHAIEPLRPPPDVPARRRAR